MQLWWLESVNLFGFSRWFMGTSGAALVAQAFLFAVPVSGMAAKSEDRE